MEMRSTQCCGVKEFSGLTNPNSVLWFISTWFFEQINNCAFILFTDPVEFNKGEELKNEIFKLGLGSVTETEAKENPNSTRMLKAYLFAPDIDMLRKWHEQYKSTIVTFKVGDMVEGINPDRYTITRTGWQGTVLDVKLDIITVRGKENCNFDVESIYFKKIS